MIARILEELAGRVEAADAVIKLDETLTLAISPEGDTRVSGGRSRMTHLRVLRDGRVGHASAGGGGDAIDGLGERALAAAAAGSSLELLLPAPAPLPEVGTRTPQAAAADAQALDQLARALLERLQRTGRRIEVWAERSAGSVQVGNTRGVQAGYETTLAGVGAVIESISAGSAPPCRVHASSAALPELGDLERLVDEADRRLTPRPLDRVPQLPARPLVCFAPRAAAGLLRPLRAALAGREAWIGSSPLRAKLGERAFDEKLSLTDDPLVAVRPGSRPVDDDGVISRRVPLIERGRLLGFLSDLETGVRAGVPSTGHAWRTGAAPPRVGFTNLRITPGVETRGTLLTMLGRGLLVEELEWSGAPNPLSGALALPVPWCYLVEGGAVRGRLEGIRLTGNLFQSLTRLAAVGGDATWVGAYCVPSLVVEGLTVTRTA